MVKRKTPQSRQEEKRLRTKSLLSVHKTSNQIARAVGISRQSVSNIRKRKKVGRRKGSGRQEVLDKRNKIRINHLVKHNPFLSAQDIQVQLDLPCTPRTVCNYLHELGYKRRKPEVMLPLDDDMKSVRVAWCRRFQTSKNFRKTIYTDEAGFWVFDNNKVGWFKSGVSDVQVTDSYAGKLNVWGAISSRGKVAVHVFSQNLKTPKYLDILSNHLIPAADRLYPNNWLLQQDNHPVHTSNDSMIFLNNNIEMIDWPGYSCDLSPIENLWPILKRNVRKRKPENVMELENYIYEEWDMLDNQYIKDLCNSIHDRISMCIENQGDKIKY